MRGSQGGKEKRPQHLCEAKGLSLLSALEPLLMAAAPPLVPAAELKATG